MNKKCFSIIVPVFNTKIEQFIECINSILRCDLELLKDIIIVDDGNNEEYQKKLKASINQFITATNLIKLVRSNINKGLAHSRKLGYDNSRGDYLIFIDSDDIVIDNKFLNKISDIFNKNSNLEFVRYSYIQFDNRFNINIQKDLSKNYDFKVIVFNNKILFDNYVWQANMVWQFAFKKEIFIRTPQLLNCINEYFEDVYFISCFAGQSFIGANTSEPFIGYRMHNKNSIWWKVKQTKKKDPLNEITRIYKWFTSFDEYNISQQHVTASDADSAIVSNEQAFECWIAWCLVAILIQGYSKTKKQFPETPSKQQIKDFVKKYDYWKNKKLNRLILKLVLKNKIFDFLISFMIVSIYRINWFFKSIWFSKIH